MSCAYRGPKSFLSNILAFTRQHFLGQKFTGVADTHSRPRFGMEVARI